VFAARTLSWQSHVAACTAFMETGRDACCRTARARCSGHYKMSDEGTPRGAGYGPTQRAEFVDMQDKSTNGRYGLCFYLRFSRCGKGLSLPWSIHVVIFPFYIDPDGLINPLLLRRQRVDFVWLAIVRVPWGCHICLGEVSGSAVRGVEEGLVVAHHRQSLLKRKKHKRSESWLN